MKHSLLCTAAILSMTALPGTVQADDHPPRDKAHVQSTSTSHPTRAAVGSIYSQLVAVLHAGHERVVASIDKYDGPDLYLSVVHGRALRAPAARVSDLQVTLFLKDGRKFQPPLKDPDRKSDFMMGSAMVNTVTEGARYSLKGIPFDQLSAVQVVFRKQPSERVLFRTP